MVKIFVGRLSPSVVKEDIEEIFKKYGEVVDCCVLRNYGFVHMSKIDEAQAAIIGLDKYELKGNSINVELSTTKVQKSTKVFVGNLPEKTSPSAIHTMFMQYGTVIECEVVRNFAFVHMGKDTMARNAIMALNNTEFEGNKIVVQMSRNKSNNMDRSRGESPLYDGYRGPPRGRPSPPMRSFLHPPPHPRRSMMSPRHMRRSYEMNSPYMRPSAGSRGSFSRPRLRPVAADGSFPCDLGSSYRDEFMGHHRSEVFAPPPYSPYIHNDREPLAPPNASYSNSASNRYSYHLHADHQPANRNTSVNRHLPPPPPVGYPEQRAYPNHGHAAYYSRPRYALPPSDRFSSPPGPTSSSDQFLAGY